VNQNRLLNKIIKSLEQEPETWEVRRPYSIVRLFHINKKISISQYGCVEIDDGLDFDSKNWTKKNLKKLKEALNRFGESQPFSMLNLAIQTNDKILDYLDKCLDDIHGWEDRNTHKSGLKLRPYDYGYSCFHISEPRNVYPGFWRVRKIKKKMKKIDAFFENKKKREDQAKFRDLLAKLDE
jgi:hypothetical protein